MRRTSHKKDSSESEEQSGGNWRSWLLLIGLLLLPIGYVTVMDLVDGIEPESQPIERLYDDVAEDKVKTVTLIDENRKAEVLLDDGSEYIVSYTEGYGADLATYLRENDVNASVESIPFSQRYQTFIVYMILALATLYMLWRLGVFSRLRGMGATYVPERPKERFSDIGGADEAVAELSQTIDMLRHPDKYRRFGIAKPDGMLLYGPPGTGKTLLARATAGEANVPFFALSGSELVSSKFAGMGVTAVKSLFRAVREYPAAIIFIDEFDALASARSTRDDSVSRDRNSTIGALLTEMDGFNTKGSGPTVFILAATNRPDELDPAVKRPGRLSRHVTMPNPDRTARKMILELHASKLARVGNVNFDKLARFTSGMSGAQLRALVNQAGLLALKEGGKKPIVTEHHFMEALETTEIGPARKNREVIEHDRKITAVHEAGHTIVGQFLDRALRPQRVTIVPRGNTGGHTRFHEEDSEHLDVSQLKARLAVSLGGRAAEKLVFGEDRYTIGAAHDLESATAIATHMIADWGMGKYTAQVEPDLPDVLEEVNELLEHSEQTAREVIEKYRYKFDALVERLLVDESLSYSDLDEFFA